MVRAVEEILERKVEVRAILCERSISLDMLLSLSEGGILMLHDVNLEEIAVMVGDSAVGSGQVVVLAQERLGVQLRQVQLRRSLIEQKGASPQQGSRAAAPS